MRVLLLEAGGAADGLTYHVPAFHGLATEDPALQWDYFVRHYASDELQARDPKFISEQDGVLYPRAGTLGGCTAHNAMITVYPHNHDFDAIASATGDRTWRSDNMRKCFQRMERCHYVRRPWSRLEFPLLSRFGRFVESLLPGLGNPSRHGFEGWLSTSLASPELALRDRQLLGIILSASEQTLADDLGRPLSLLEGLSSFVDPNDWRVQGRSLEGVWLTPLATDAGQRNGTREY